MAGRKSGNKKRKTPPHSPRQRSPTKKGRQDEPDDEQRSQNSFSDSDCSSKSHATSHTSANSKTQKSDSTTNLSSVQPPTTSSQPQTIPKLKLPPIIITSAQWRKAGPAFYSKPENRPDKISAKASSDRNVHITTIDVDQFRALQSYLIEQNIEFHTFKLPAERTLKVVIKGIAKDISEDELKEELKNRNFEVQLVRRFGTTAKPLPICMVLLNRTESAKDIYEITNLFYVQVTVEAYIKSGPSQCYSCQRFGHGSQNCGHAPRCVKCAGTHLTKDCTKTLDKEPTCCNCGEAHTANYKKCPFYLHVTSVESNKATKTPNTIQQTVTNPVPNLSQPLTASKPLYSNITKNKTGIQVDQILTLLLDLMKNLTTSEDPKTLMITTINSFIQLLTNHHG